MTEPRRLSERGLSLVNRRERCVLRPYRGREQPIGEYTIGWGHAMRKGEPILGIRWGDDGVPTGWISQATADDLRRRDLQWVVADVERFVRVPLTQNQFDALCSLVYNNGALPLRQTLGERLNAGDYAGAAEAFPLYCKRAKVDPKTGKNVVDPATGRKVLVRDPDLVDRRDEEAALFVLDDEAMTCGLPEGEP